MTDLASSPPRTRDVGRVPPNNLEAEESLLGAMLLTKDAIVAATEVGVSTDDFYKPAHGHVFDAIVSLYGAGEPVDPVTVAEALRRTDLLEAIGGPGEIAELGYGLPDDVRSAVDRAEALVFQVAQRRVSDTSRALRDVLDAALDRLEMLYDKGDAVTGVPTGFRELDDITAGLQPSSLVIVGARPGAGKTSFALGIAAHAALEAHRPVLFFSLEMDHQELAQRLLAAEAKVESTRLRNGRLQDADWNKLMHAIGRMAEAPPYVDDNPMTSVLDIRAKARRLKASLGDLGLVVIDYLQLMTGRVKAENRQVEVSEISRGLKILARELQCPVIALSQLSRNLEQRADKRPVLADLRESGSLEQDADVVMFLYRDKLYNRDSVDQGAAEVHIAKHRSGPTATFELVFLERYTRFADLAKDI